MNLAKRLAGAAMLALVAAQPAPAQSNPALAGAPVVQSAGGIDYVNGGIGEGARAAMTQMQERFALRLVFSNSAGQYLVADRVTVRRGDREVMSVSQAGPILMLGLAPGSYTIDADYGGRSEHRTVSVGSAAQAVNWRL